VVEFFLRDLSVAVFVEDGDHRWHHGLSIASGSAGGSVSGARGRAVAAVAGRTVGLLPAVAWRSGRRAVGCLGGREARGQGERECDED
jgi:hypothetical protein